MYKLTERSFDDECINHHKSTVREGCKMQWIKTNNDTCVMI